MDPLRAMRVFSKVVDEGSFAAAVARSEAILCASPEYLDRRGRPQLPTDLLQHGSRLPPVNTLAQGHHLCHR